MRRARERRQSVYKHIIAGLAVMAAFLMLGRPQLKRYLLACGLFFLPFSYDYTLYTYTVVENFYGRTDAVVIRLSDVFFALLFLLCPKHALRPEGPQRIVYWFDRAVALFLLVSAFSVTYAISRRTAALALVELLKITVLYYYLASRYLSWQSDGRFIVKCLAVSVLFQSSLALFQAFSQDFYSFFRTGSAAKVTLFGDFIRSQGTASAPNLFAEYITVILLILLAALLSGGVRRNRLLLTIFMMGVAALIATLSRGAWLSLCAGSGFLLYRYGWLRRFRTWLVLGVGLALMVAVARQRLVGDDEGAAMDRYHLARIAAEIIEAHPILGVGINNYRLAVYKYIPEDYEWNLVTGVHTLVLLTAAEMGILGVLALLNLFWRGFSLGLSTVCPEMSGDRLLALGLAAGCLAIMVHNLFDSVWSSEIVSSLFFFLAGLSSPLTKERL